MHVHGEGDTRDKMRGINGQGMFRGAPNGGFYDDHRYKMSIKPSLKSHLFCFLVVPNLNLKLCIKAA
jgi:hypothetical protein